MQYAEKVPEECTRLIEDDLARFVSFAYQEGVNLIFTQSGCYSTSLSLGTDERTLHLALPDFVARGDPGSYTSAPLQAPTSSYTFRGD